jgi:hypothetical protein
MNQKIYFADSSIKDKIDSLRMQEYATASGFLVDLTTLKWKSSDDESYVMVAENQGQLVSTMRGEIIKDLTVLEKKLECPWDFPLEIEMPVLLLSRAATLSTYRSAGLNLVLRYWFLRFAIENNIRFVVGTFVAGSPRENSLREMGYQFFTNKFGWQQSTYRSTQPVTVVALDMKNNGDQALAYCLKRVPKTIAEYFFMKQKSQLRYVSHL